MRLKGLNLLTRFSLALAAVGLIPLAVIPYLVRLNREAVTDQVLRTHAVAARSSAARIESFLDAVQQGVEAVALNPELSANPRSAGAQDLLAGLLQAQPLIVGLVLENRKGGEVLRVQSRARAEIVAAVLAAPTDRTLVPRRELGALWLRLTTPLPGDVGRLRAVIDASPLESLMRNEELGREAVIAAISDPDGVVVASEPGVTLEAFPPSMLAAARTGHVSGASRFVGTGDGASLGAYAPLTRSGWYVLSRQPVRIAEQVAVQMQRQSLVAVAVALALTALLSGLAYASVVRPARALIAAQQRLARIGQRPPAGDEIAQLRAGVAVLERQTQDREALDRIFLGRYLVMEVLGSGGMGTVFRGFDPKLQREVALKTVHLEEGEPSERHAAAQTGLLKEAITLARLSHANIVAVYDVEDAGQVSFIAMELVKGTDLHTLLCQMIRLPPELLVPLAAAVARGLSAAHSHGVVHRDIKPSNVLLGSDGSIKVTDFGIAAAVASMPSGPVVVGTPGYIPPEALAGQPHTPTGDLFGLGVLMYEALAGRAPFEASSVQEVLVRTQVRRPEPLEALCPGIPEELAALVLGLLEPQPETRRPASARETAERLETAAATAGWRWSFPGPPAVPAAWEQGPTRALTR